MGRILSFLQSGLDHYHQGSKFQSWLFCFRDCWPLCKHGSLCAAPCNSEGLNLIRLALQKPFWLFPYLISLARCFFVAFTSVLQVSDLAAFSCKEHFLVLQKGRNDLRLPF